MKIRPDGTFTSRSSYTDSLLGKKLGQEGRAPQTVKGRFGRATVSGTWRVDVKIVLSASGTPLDSCSSGLLTFTAVR